jgi:tRNA (cytidine/uridine-2'-O-)-methyltransferase
MFNIVLFEPEIPPNTGNAIRLCANAGLALHLIEPLGFDIDEKAVRRAGLDYAEMTNVRTWPSLEACLAALAPPRWFAITTKGSTRFDIPRYVPGDTFVFGPESRGLPEAVRNACPEECRLRIPMLPSNRSLNLSNAVALVAYEAWKQHGFQGGT